jgi:hypothetical protein
MSSVRFAASLRAGITTESDGGLVSGIGVSDRPAARLHICAAAVPFPVEASRISAPEAGQTIRAAD